MTYNLNTVHQEKNGLKWVTTRTENKQTNWVNIEIILDSMKAFRKAGGKEVLNGNRLTSTSPNGMIRTVRTWVMINYN